MMPIAESYSMIGLQLIISVIIIMLFGSISQAEDLEKKDCKSSQF